MNKNQRLESIIKLIGVLGLVVIVGTITSVAFLYFETSLTKSTILGSGLIAGLLVTIFFVIKYPPSIQTVPAYKVFQIQSKWTKSLREVEQGWYLLLPWEEVRSQEMNIQREIFLETLLEETYTLKRVVTETNLSSTASKIGASEIGPSCKVNYRLSFRLTADNAKGYFSNESGNVDKIIRKRMTAKLNDILNDLGFKEAIDKLKRIGEEVTTYLRGECANELFSVGIDPNSVNFIIVDIDLAQALQDEVNAIISLDATMQNFRSIFGALRDVNPPILIDQKTGLPVLDSAGNQVNDQKRLNELMDEAMRLVRYKTSGAQVVAVETDGTKKGTTRGKSGVGVTI